ncbi:MAG: type III pantothenate kinase [Oligosphaeraceae bacterium]|nr:type III pantothenate kinase [Oligosphaeraceae bacterium]
MLFVLNIGNTHTQLARQDDGELKLLEKLPSAELLQLEFLRHLESRHAMSQGELLAASVLPAATAALSEFFADSISFATVQSYPGIDFDGYDTSTLGADRLANAAAALELYGTPVLVVDCGTCITSESLDAQRRFRGGVIMPGRAMQLRSMNLLTAQLPDLPLEPQKTNTMPACTAQAMQAGVAWGCIGAVKEIIREMKKQPGMQNCQCVAAGGDRRFFCENIPELEMAPELFTLRGVALAAKN